MRTLRFILITLGFALAAIPASATITYTACDGGCTVNSGGTYAAWQGAPGATGLAFSSLTTFVSGGLAGSGIYTDSTTGTIFTNYSSGGSVDALTQVNNSSFLQWGYTGSGTGIEIVLSANTYAFAMSVGDCNGGSCGNNLFNAATVGPGTQSSHSVSYQLTLGTGQPHFFGIVSSTPITSVFLASGGNNNLSINSFEIGQESPVPEARTSLMIGGGLIALYFCRRRRPQQHFEVKLPSQMQSPRQTISAMTPVHQ